MKEQIGQALLVTILLCASVAFVGSMTGWIDLRHLAESFPSPPTIARPQQAASNSISGQPTEQQATQRKVPEAKSPEPKAINPAPPPAAPVEPRAVEPRPPEQLVRTAEVKPPQQAASEARVAQLKGLGREAAGYSLYSYGLLTTASPRSAALLGEIFKSMPSIGDSAPARAQLNIFYIPTRNGTVADLPALLSASRGDQTKTAVRYSETIYDYKTARAILNHLCNPPAKAMTSLCKGPMSQGPYILANARPASILEPVPPPFVLVDLSDVNPRAYAEFISAFTAVVKADDVTDDAKLHSLREKVLNVTVTAADWTPKVRRSLADIVHAFDSSPSGQAFR